MRKYIKNRILKAINVMKDAHCILERVISENGNELMELLTELQNIGIMIGNEIEQSEGEGHEIVTLLEEYCELIWQCSQADGAQKQKKYCNELKKSTEIFSKRIKNDIQESYEIVFLPYKASMWDTFESIWKATIKNEKCEAYVVPIPYYEKNLDGSFGEMHYEGEAYPEYVPVVAVDEYDIENRHPDIIFIHNPYDNNNLVTSVHPYYYSERLKGLTQLLVFIPYAVSSKDSVAEVFAVIPGTAYADKVITQSETIRQGYINWFHKYERENHCEGTFGNAETKFCALGSPKFDKVVCTKREDICFSEKWESMVIRPDGTRKKVVLLNTTINTILQWNEKYLDKLKCDLKKFKNRDDVLLIWRPHPLLEITYNTMRPELAQSYAEIVADYRSEGWGIYDESGDLYSAVTFSDAYFGDWSSVATLYQCIGKPVMLRSHIESESKQTLQLPISMRQLNITSFCIDNDTAYLYNSDNDCVYYFNLYDKKAILKTVLPHDTKAPKNGYFHVDMVGNSLVFTPNKASTAIMYDLNTEEQRPYSAYTDLDKNMTSVTSFFQNCVTKVNDGEFHWWCNQAGELYKWNPKTKENILFCEFSKMLSSKPEGILDYSLAFSKGYLYALPHRYHPTIENKAFKIDIKAKKIIELPRLSVGAEAKAYGVKGLLCYCDVCVGENDVVYTYSNIKNAMIIINSNTDELLEIPVVFDINSIFNHLRSYVWEGPYFSLDHLLVALCGKEYSCSIETIKESAISINLALTQITSRFFREGEPDIGVHQQEGKNGQRILDMLLQEI